ncbi:MAG: acyltransferase [Gammaproteobacteria bacterium]|nr:acyltransferase [Gammaproteobacteria bacterium]
MSRSFSLYLDIIRFLAALLVFLYHSNQDFQLSNPLFHMGHEAVVIFFVMSGFIIAFCRDVKEKHISEFIVNRASRIYSVVLPAIILTLAADLLGNQIAPELYGDHYDLIAVRILSSLAFTNELWVVSIQSLSNVPYWSINYEVWYYVMFAVVFYSRSWGVAMLVCILFVVGPKIAMLAPCWWIGVWLYRKNPLGNCSLTLNSIIFICSVLAFSLFISYGISSVGWNMFESWLPPELFLEFAFSRNFLSDYLLTMIIVANFASARILFASFEITENKITRLIRHLANFTFTLYLLHQPLIELFTAVLSKFELSAAVNHSITVIGIFILILFIGHPIENSKKFYRNYFNNLLLKLPIFNRGELS